MCTTFEAIHTCIGAVNIISTMSGLDLWKVYVEGVFKHMASYLPMALSVCACECAVFVCSHVCFLCTHVCACVPFIPMLRSIQWPTSVNFHRHYMYI